MVQVRAVVVARAVDKVEAVARVVVGAQDKARAVDKVVVVARVVVEAQDKVEAVVKAAVEVWGVAGVALGPVANASARTAARLFHTGKVCLVLR